MPDIGTITEIKEETHDVKTFRLSPSKRIDFLPGQYCLVSFINNREFADEQRPFTFSSSPTEKNFIEITVKDMGGFTTALHRLAPGKRLLLDGPYGEKLNFDETVKENAVFLAGGSGITPFISAIRYSIAKNLQNKLLLIFSNRTEKDIIYREELSALNRDNIKIVYALSDEIPEGWSGETGVISLEMIRRYVENPQEKLWYICGPPKMIDAMKEILRSMEISEKNLRIESWQISGKND